jgi:23S rRNA C2498 (ribose-2'-O)-methylase RlmM
MAVDVHAARIPDRDRLVELLREHGLAAEPHGELDIEVAAADEGGELFAYVEELVLNLGATMIPLKHDGVIYLRPPVG